MPRSSRALTRHLGSISLLLLAGALPAHGELVAERISPANFATHHVGGPDADAGIDDWFLSNGTICAAISPPLTPAIAVPDLATMSRTC